MTTSTNLEPHDSEPFRANPTDVVVDLPTGVRLPTGVQTSHTSGGSDPVRRVASIKTVSEFRAHLSALGVDVPVDDEVVTGDGSPLARSLEWNGRRIGNRVAIHPMEGWDGTPDGSITPAVRRRWQRFGLSGAKLIWGCEAMAVRHDGRANPNQLILDEPHSAGIREVRDALVEAHSEAHGQTDDLVIGFQLTHSGRYCRPNPGGAFEPRVAFRHPLLDARFRVSDDSQILTDADLRILISDYVKSARLALECGADFVDIKHCHGYLLHEFLGARGRSGEFGGSFENRTRLLREIVAGIRADGNPIGLGVRLSAFDFLPFVPDASRARNGRLGPGMPVGLGGLEIYPFGFGHDPANPLVPDLTETRQFIELCHTLGITLINLTAGSPYYVPHIQRPAAFPPSDGYQPPEDPLVGVARQIAVVRAIKATAPPEMVFVGTGYSYLQEFLPNVAQATVRQGWVDSVGLGRMVLSYPEIITEAVGGHDIARTRVCRTFSDCTTAPRNGLPSGCYPLDPHYKATPEAEQLKKIKQAAGV